MFATLFAIVRRRGTPSLAGGLHEGYVVDETGEPEVYETRQEARARAKALRAEAEAESTTRHALGTLPTYHVVLYVG